MSDAGQVAPTGSSHGPVDDGGDPILPEDHYLLVMAIELGLDGGNSMATVTVRPELFAPGTDHIRTGLLCSMVDLVAGHMEIGPVGPTIDLRMQLFTRPPAEGRIHIYSRPLRIGSRLIVSETELRGDHDTEPFARCLTTFMNNIVGGGFPKGPRVPPVMAETSFDAFLGHQIRDENSFELHPVERLTNGMKATVQGGAQSLLAELTAEHVLGGGRRLAATDLDIRFLNPMRVGPVVATVQHIDNTIGEDNPKSAGAGGRARCRVRLTDGGYQDRILGFVAMTLEPIV
jgi:acyl-coenzyme A thioesterase PaaI-like protein